MDLAQALQMKRGIELLHCRINAVRDALVKLAVKYRSTPLVARTVKDGQLAVNLLLNN